MVFAARSLGRKLPAFTLGVCLIGIVVAAAVPSAFGGRADFPGYPEQPDLITLAPLSQTNFVGEEVTHTATITDKVPSAFRFGVTVTFTVLEGPSTGRTFTATTDSNGSASFTYTIPVVGQLVPTLPNAGADQIQASFFDGHEIIGSNWVGQGWEQAAVGQEVPGRPPALVQEPGSTTLVPANATQDLPPGTTLDVSGNRGISVLNFFNRRMTFLGVPDGVLSRFVLINGLRRPGLPIRMRLTGGNFGKCKTSSTRTLASLHATKKPKPVRRLWGTGKGRYVTTGKYASATVRGTFWLIADYCDGTLVQVREGTVVVRDLVTKKLKVVTPGHPYFAKAPS